MDCNKIYTVNNNLFNYFIYYYFFTDLIVFIYDNLKPLNKKFTNIRQVKQVKLLIISKPINLEHSLTMIKIKLEEPFKVLKL